MVNLLEGDLYAAEIRIRDMLHEVWGQFAPKWRGQCYSHIAKICFDIVDIFAAIEKWPQKEYGKVLPKAASPMPLLTPFTAGIIWLAILAKISFF
jgi:hypothetical protein